jgi:hypothetical protein
MLMPFSSYMKKHWKKALIITGMLAFLVIATGLYLQQRWNRTLRTQLRHYVKEMSDSLYTLRYTKLKLNVFTGSLTLENASLVMDTAVYRRLRETQRAPSLLYTLSAERIHLRYFKVWRYFSKKELSAGALALQNPSIVLQQDLRNRDTSRPYNAYERLSGRIRSLSIGTLALDSTNLKYVRIKQDGSRAITQLHHLSILVNDLLIDSLAVNDPSRFLYAHNYTLGLRDYAHRTPDSLYSMNLRQISYNAAEKTLRIGQFSVEPRYNRVEFDRRGKTQRDRFEVKLNNIAVRNLDPQALLEEQRLIAQRVDIGSGNFHIYRNRNLPMPPGNKLGRYPHQLLQKLNVPVSVDTLTGQRVDLLYTEANPKTQQEGTIVFRQLSGNFRNITNIDSLVKKNPHCIAELDAVLMKSGMLQTHFDFSLDDRGGGFTVSGQLKNMDGRQLTPVTRPLSMVEIRSCQIRDLSFRIKGNEKSASGEVKFIYNNLRVSILKKDTGTHQLKRKGLLSLFANAIAINDSNPPQGGQVFVAHPRLTRDPQRSFFNLIWKTIFAGLKETAITGKVQL